MTRRMVWMFALVGAACGSETKNGDGTTLGTDPMLEELEGLIAGYEGWPQVEQGVVDGTTVHGDHIENWPNDVAKAHIDAAAGGDMPDGAVLVKQGYNDAAGTDPKNLTVMWKTGGEWYWASWNAAGENVEAGFDVPGCVNCHEATPGGQDLVFSYSW